MSVRAIPKAKTNQGFTLIEILVGLTLSTIVLGAVLAVYIPSLKSWKSTNNLSELQDSEATLHDLFSSQIRQAGLLSCRPQINVIDGVSPQTPASRARVSWALPMPPALPVPPAPPTASTFLTNPFQAFSSNDANINAQINGLDAARQSDGAARVGDVFYVLAPSTGYFRVQNLALVATADSSHQIQLTNPAALIQAGQFFLINDCNATILVRASVDSQPGQLSFLSPSPTTAPTALNPNTVITGFESTVYYIGTLNGTPTLYSRTIQNTLANNIFQVNTNPLVTGVENMRVEYGVAPAVGGVATPQIVDYRTPSQMNGATMQDVRTVKISLMLRATRATSDTVQASLSFPDVTGAMVDCYVETNPNATACPGYVTSAAGRQFSRKVVSFTFLLPRFAAI